MKRTGRVVLKRVFMSMSLALFAMPAAAANAAQERSFLREDFDSLDSWKAFQFPKISRPTTYTIVRATGGDYLEMQSDCSASGIVWKREFAVRDYPKLRWRWKVENVYRKGNAKTKAGDDFPVRLFVLFRCPEDAGFLARRESEGARRLCGGVPVHTALCYIWANRRHPSRVLTNRYAEKVKMLPLRQGAGSTGKWLVEETDILEDYRRAFRKPAPETARLAIMSDSDNTRERSVAYIDFIELSR